MSQLQYEVTQINNNNLDRVHVAFLPYPILFHLWNKLCLNQINNNHKHWCNNLLLPNHVDYLIALILTNDISQFRNPHGYTENSKGMAKAGEGSTGQRALEESCWWPMPLEGTMGLRGGIWTIFLLLNYRQCVRLTSVSGIKPALPAITWKSNSQHSMIANSTSTHADVILHYAQTQIDDSILGLCAMQIFWKAFVSDWLEIRPQMFNMDFDACMNFW